MMNRKISTSVGVTMITSLLTMAGTFAFAEPMKPELAAKREKVRQQQEQRVTKEKRQVATDGLKAERAKIFNAHQGDPALNQGQDKGQSKDKGQDKGKNQDKGKDKK